MTEQTGTESAQGDDDAQAQGATPPAQGAEPQTAQGASGDDGDDVAALRAQVAKLDKDNRSYRQKAKREEAERAKQAESELSETERLTARNAELEQQLTERTKREQEQSLRLASMTSAQKLGYRNPDLAYRLIDSDAVEYGDEGEPLNVEAMLTALAKTDPYLLSQTDFGGGQRGASPAGADDMNARIRRAVGR